MAPRRGSGDARAGTDLVAAGSGPLLNAAGTIKTPQQFQAALKLPIGAITVGSYTVDEREGNAGDVFGATSVASINALGLPGPAIAVWSDWLPDMRLQAEDNDKKLWVSVAGFNPDEYRQLVETALEAGADVIEVNLSCPNIWQEGEQKPIVSFSAEQTALALARIAEVVSSDATVGVKLSPILDLALMRAIDVEILASGLVSFVTTMNTVPNCFGFSDSGTALIDALPHLGGLGGPATKWIAQGQVICHRRFLGGLPIVGAGGITTGSDLKEFLTEPVGAVLGQTATAYWQRGPRAIIEILEGWV